MILAGMGSFLLGVDGGMLAPGGNMVQPGCQQQHHQWAPTTAP